MSSKYIKWVALALVLVAAAAFGFSQMQHRAWGPGRMHHRFLGYLAHYLQLTDAQKAEIKSMWEAEKPTAMPLIQQLANGRKQMLALTANGQFDEAKVRALADQQSQTLAQLMVEKAKLESQIYSKVLTPEQRQKADQLRQKQTSRIDEWLHKLETGPQSPQSGQ